MEPRFRKGVMPTGRYRIEWVVGPPSGFLRNMAIPESALMEKETDNDAPQSNQLGGCLIRLLWMVVGNLVLVLAAVNIHHHGGGFQLTAADAVFWCAALLLPAIRYIDIRSFSGRTADNQPATMAHWARYSIVLLAISLAVWGAAHLI
jgi:hypothetical protein